MTTYAKVIPLSIIWDNAKIYEIDKVLEIKPIASTKGGGVGIRYKCKIRNKIRYLFLNDYLWWIELD